MNRKLCMLALMALAACSAEERSNAAGSQQRASGSALSASALPLTSLRGDELLRQLKPGAARSLCREADRLIDLCSVAGRRLGPRACAQTVSACRAQDPGPSTDCSDARFDFPEPCSATADEYLACVGAWSRQQQSCVFDTFLSDAPPQECLPLLQKCPLLEQTFGPASTVVRRCAPDSPPRPPQRDDIVGLDCGLPAPARMVTLGDSIAACFAPSDYSACAPTLIADYVRDQYAPALAYGSLAVPGQVTADVLSQAALIPTGPGHLLVWLYVGGNDLLRCQLPTLSEAQACADAVLAALPATWERIFAFFDDAQRFPDGVTLLLNTQYSLWDQCTHPLGPERGAFADTTVRRFNQLIAQLASERPNAIAVDQYPDFLGHARNANHEGCPHCSSDDNSLWLFDGTHPNDRGNRHIADKWKSALDRLYGAECTPN